MSLFFQLSIIARISGLALEKKDLAATDDGRVLYRDRCRAQEEEDKEMGPIECTCSGKSVQGRSKTMGEKLFRSQHLDLLEVSFKKHKEIIKIYLVICVKLFKYLDIICKVPERVERVHEERG